MEKKYQYVIAGSGLAGVSAIEGIRAVDKESPILLIGAEPDLPYDRPPLSKKLWTGKKKLEEIVLHDEAWYRNAGVDLALGTTVAGIDAKGHAVVLSPKNTVTYARLLLATGGSPRTLAIPGGDLPEICYFRTVADYKKINALARKGVSALVIGGGFIGSELACALAMKEVAVTMIFPEDYLVERVYPAGLGNALMAMFRARGITVLPRDIPVAVEKEKNGLLVRTRNNAVLKADFIIAGIGIAPETSLAGKAGLAVTNGVKVDDYLASSDPDIFAAGDNAEFYSYALRERMRIEHWDNSIAQGKTAGANMAGGRTRFDYIPYFFSDLFEFGYEAAGVLDARLATESFWKKENDTGIIYYLHDSRVKGVMLCNVWDKVEAAREVIREQRVTTSAELAARIDF